MTYYICYRHSSGRDGIQRVVGNCESQARELFGLAYGPGYVIERVNYLKGG